MLDCNTLTEIENVEAIAPAWHDLYQRIGSDYFAGYTPFKVWWQTIAQEKMTTLHVVTGHRDGKLVALFPLVVCKKKGFRILFWAGYDAFLGDLALYENQDDLDELWQFVAKSPYFDAAELRYISQNSAMEEVLSKRRCACQIEEDFLTSIRFEGMDSQAWLAGLPRKVRTESKRKMKRLFGTGAVKFDVYQKDIPKDLLRTMIDHKREWCVDRGYDSRAFFNPEYIPQLVKEASEKGDVRFFCLSIDGMPISFALGFICGKTIYVSVLAHDPSCMELSPGVMVIVETIKWCADYGLDEFSFMEGREDFKVKYGNTRRVIVTYSFCRTIWGYVARTLLVVRHNDRVRAFLQKIRRR